MGVGLCIIGTTPFPCPPLLHLLAPPLLIHVAVELCCSQVVHFTRPCIFGISLFLVLSSCALDGSGQSPCRVNVAELMEVFRKYQKDCLGGRGGLAFPLLRTRLLTTAWSRGLRISMVRVRRTLIVRLTHFAMPFFFFSSRVHPVSRPGGTSLPAYQDAAR